MTRQEASGAREPGQAPSHCHQPTRAGNGRQQKLQLKQEFRRLWKPEGLGVLEGHPRGWAGWDLWEMPGAKPVQP